MDRSDFTIRSTIAGLLALGLTGIGVPAAGAQDVAALKAQLAQAQRDARFWQQLTAPMAPVKMTSMTDHRAYMLPGGTVIALHFDNMNLDKAANLNWMALGIAGKFCKTGQERIERQFGPGFVHFHSMKNDTHGGQPGEDGVWFVHVGARNFTSPFGPVREGVPDAAFMPTPAPAC